MLSIGSCSSQQNNPLTILWAKHVCIKISWYNWVEEKMSQVSLFNIVSLANISRVRP